MSTEKFDQYKEVYSKYILLAIELHNYHQQFISRRGFRTAKVLRSKIKEIMAVEKVLWKISVAAYEECLINFKEEQRQKKADLKAWKRAHPGKPGRKKRILNGNN